MTRRRFPRAATTAAYASTTLDSGEILFDEQVGRFIGGDGSTAGGFGLVDEPTYAANSGATFSSPAIIAPGNNPVADLRGHVLPGDRYEHAAYRKVATEPTHPGKIKIGDDWYELMDGFDAPDIHYRTGDANDAASFLRARDVMLRKTGPVVLQLQPRVYDCGGVTMDFGGIAAQFIGTGMTESGDVGGFNTNITGFTEPARGSWIRAGVVGAPAFKFSGGNARGAFINRVGFVQSHPNIASGWAPTNYGFLFEAMNAQGGLDIGDIKLIGINRAIFSDNSGRLTIDRLRGQVYTDGILIDHAYDETFINHVHLWTYNGAQTPVAAYMQANMRGLRMGRVDGIHINKWFQISTFRSHSFEGWRTKNDGSGGTTFRGLPESEASNPLYASLPNGPVTHLQCENLYSDATKVGIYIQAPTSFASYFRLVHQGQDIQSSDGSALANSAAIKADSTAGGGLIAVHTLHVERATNMVKSTAGLSIEVTSSPYARYMPNAAQLFSSTGGSPVSLVRPPTWPQNCPAGTYGTDFTCLDDQLIYSYAPIADSNGAVVVAHTLGNITARLRTAYAQIKGNSGEAVTMRVRGLDGNYIYCDIDTNAAGPAYQYAGRPTRITLRVNRFGDTW